MAETSATTTIRQLVDSLPPRLADIDSTFLVRLSNNYFWTPELKQEARSYLRNELPDDICSWLLDPRFGRPLQPGRKNYHVGGLLVRDSRYEKPIDLVIAIRDAAIAASYRTPAVTETVSVTRAGRIGLNRKFTSTYGVVKGVAAQLSFDATHQVIAMTFTAAGHANAYPIRVEPQGRAQVIANKFFQANSLITADLAGLYPYEQHPASIVGGSESDTALLIPLTPAELPAAREFEFGPPPTDLIEAERKFESTDLTDDEWELLKISLGLVNDHRAGGRHRSYFELDAKRRTFNAVRFITAHDVPWSHLPQRYGAWRSTYLAYVHYRTEGLFVRLRAALKDSPEAEELVAWLDQVVDGVKGTAIGERR